MRIAMIGRDLPRPGASGGVSGQIHLLADALSRRGNEITVYALNPPTEMAGYAYQPIPVPPAIGRNRRAALYLAPWWVHKIPLDNFDVVHAHGDDHLIRTRRPVVRTFYGAERAEAEYSTTLRQRLYHLSMVPFEWISERRATAIVAISQSTQQHLARRAVVIPCGYDPSLFYPAGPKSQHPSILFVGDLRTRKRAELLLETFSKTVRVVIPQAELWMVTSDTVSGAGVRPLGRVSTEELVDLYRRAWVYCMPSSYEGFGVPYLEAMACGTPVVATANGGAEEVLDEGRAGRITRDTELGTELVSVLTDNSVREVLVAAGLKRAKQFEISRIADQYLALYETLVGDMPRASARVKGESL